MHLRPAGDEGLLEQAGGERPRAARDADGRIWFHTGDIARMDEDGYTSIVQRKKDMIIVDGFNVYPSEVEVGALHASGGAARGRHRRPGRVSRRNREGLHRASSRRLRDRRRNHRALPRRASPSTKCRGSVEIRDTLPMSAVGKILYRVLRDEHAADIGIRPGDS